MMMLNHRALCCLLALFLLFLFVVADSFSSHLPAPFNITVGSSISANKTSCWLSPSGNFAFGFYPSDIAKIGIWINKSSNKILIWTAKLDTAHPIDNASSVLFDVDGRIILKRPGILAEPVFKEVWQPAAYAMMCDTGNFVMYSSDSQIIWQSFDHPTDTIVSGQTLKSDNKLIEEIEEVELDKVKSDNSLVSVNSRYMVLLTKTQMVLADKKRGDFERWVSKDSKKLGRLDALNLDSIGRLSLVNSNNLVIQNLTKGENHTDWSTIYRATIGSDGVFRLYREQLLDSGQSVELWRTYCNTCHYPYWFLLFLLIISMILLLNAAFCRENSVLGEEVDAARMKVERVFCLLIGLGLLMVDVFLFVEGLKKHNA